MGGVSLPTAALEALVGSSMPSERERTQLAIAIGSLLRKGYFSTVGAVKVEGVLELGGEERGERGRRRGGSRIHGAAGGGAAGGGGGRGEGRDGGGGATRRECSLVDFAGQMEYLVSHQLLLSSMHTLSA